MTTDINIKHILLFTKIYVLCQIFDLSCAFPGTRKRKSSVKDARCLLHSHKHNIKHHRWLVFTTAANPQTQNYKRKPTQSNAFAQSSHTLYYGAK